MAKNEVKVVVVSEKRYRELYRAQILMEILHDYRNAHDEYEFERFALTVFSKAEAKGADESAPEVPDA